jgi:hypothetical protein
MAIFDFLKSNKPTGPLDAKGLREAILQFIKEELQKLEGGEGAALGALEIFVNAGSEEQFLYDTALYTSQPQKFQEEIQRIADNYALDLPEGWKLTIAFVAILPEGSLKKESLKISLQMKKRTLTSTASAVPLEGLISILKGEAEQSVYLLTPVGGRINIGRGKSVSTSDGGIRNNQIAFPEDPAFEFNKYISRQHAHIEWDQSAGTYKLFADEGGVPPGNKTKLKTLGDESTHKLNSSSIGYPLQHGDQIILADMAVLEFTIN